MHKPNLWAGTEAEYLSYIAEQEKMAMLPDQAIPQSDTPHLLSMQGDIAVVSIHGKLTNSDAWYNQLLGNSSYPAIREALIHAATNKDVKAIALDIRSGGGVVSGVADTAELISRIDSSVKPVYAYSDSHAESAAYWLGSSARRLDISPTAEVGSIGVLAIHQEYSKALENEGIKATVIRSGKFKALGNPVEPLSEEGKAALQAQVDQINTLFVNHVANARKTTPTLVEQNMGQGRVFIGQAAVDVGLADNVSSFDMFISNLKGEIDKSKNSMHISQNSFKGLTVKQALTEQQIALMAAGVVAVEAKAEAKAETVQPEQQSEPTPEPVADTTTALTAIDPVVTLLQSQLAASQQQVVALSVDLQAAKVAAQHSTQQSEAMRPIVRAAVSNLRVALGSTAAGVETLADDVLLAEYANLSAQFQSKFKAGGVAAVSSSADKESQVESDDPVRKARLAATRIGK